MRQRTEVFASIILLATVLRQGKKKKIVSKELNFIDCMTFDTLTNFYCYFYRKRNSKCLLYKYCKNNKTVSELHLHARDIIHCNYAFLCAVLIFTSKTCFSERNLIYFFVVCIYF